jgi:crossover junction endodeoxyribonuclease RuvC
LELVTPQAWKKVVLPGLIPAKAKLPPDATAAQKKAASAANKKAGKDAAIGWCRRAYPSVSLIPEGCRVPHDGIADSLCIAEYARLKFACS